MGEAETALFAGESSSAGCQYYLRLPLRQDFLDFPHVTIIRTDLQRVLKLLFRHIGFVGFQIGPETSDGSACQTRWGVWHGRRFGITFLAVGRSKRKSWFSAMESCRQELRMAYPALLFGLKAE